METANELNGYGRRPPRRSAHARKGPLGLVHCLRGRASVYLRAIGRCALWAETSGDIQGHSYLDLGGVRPWRDWVRV